ncbi:hypothetical protein ABFS82_02G053200 [Erythranthe guttata]|uniref:Exostosin GT47 domain-containing protein n=1 Tax=Erythranthe guttata TaxID=4155 RepID=A0A022PVY0_ERYGU|nr:PREDICTED: probable glycosyltransferase At5g20260 [Erythranthe guttata]EYU18405.1 hypothetical protein MIMGU_mgv1a007826mg [Erythranthe guttata]|eukprot:XP_012828457.1 PREDICTED: probable glycosyltransferase At5g20260 [Erythranthe guttata]
MAAALTVYPTVRAYFACSITLSLMMIIIYNFMTYYSNKPTYTISDDYTAVAEQISGDVYHWAEGFRMDYAQMERKLKIYAYPAPADQRYSNYQTITGKYASEGYFFKNIRESSFLTDDPELAHLFFIPISAHKLHQKVSSYDEMAAIIGEYIQRLIIKYPYWNRSLGADHFFLTCHEIDTRATERAPLLAVKNLIRVVCSPTYNSSFVPHKDVSLPLINMPFSKPPPSTANDLQNRTILGYWAGVCNTEIRERMVKLWSKDLELEIQNETAYNHARMTKFYTSKFCICPAGSRITSNRIIMAIRYGCVPVIMSDYYELPFKDVLDWRKFSVILRERDVYNLKGILKAKAGAEFRMLHTNLLKVQNRFEWNTPPVKYDAFNMVLYDLWLRRFVIK